MLPGSWQVNGYVVNLFWSFDAHKQEKKTLNFQGSSLSHKGNTLDLRWSLVCKRDGQSQISAFLGAEIVFRAGMGDWE